MISADLERAITALQAEKARIRANAETEMAAVDARIALLRRARLKVDDELDQVAEDLQQAGLWPTQRTR